MKRVFWRALRLWGFGRFFGGMEARFHPDMNVHMAPNEQGKSTLVAGLGAVLFGLQGGQSGAFSVSRFRNWNGPERCRGELEFESSGEAYLIRRDFDTRVVSVKRLQGGKWREEIRGEHSLRKAKPNEAFEDFLLKTTGLNSLSLFARTFCVGQPIPRATAGRAGSGAAGETGIDAEIQRLISGSGEASADAALRALEEALDALTMRKDIYGVGGGRSNARTPRRLEILGEQIEKLRADVEGSRAVVDSLEGLRAEIASVEERREDLRRRLRAEERVLGAWNDYRLTVQRMSGAIAEQMRLDRAFREAEKLEREISSLKERIKSEYEVFLGAPSDFLETLDDVEDMEKKAAELRSEIKTLEEALREVQRLESEAEAIDDGLRGMRDWSCTSEAPVEWLAGVRVRARECLGRWRIFVERMKEFDRLSRVAAGAVAPPEKTKPCLVPAVATAVCAGVLAWFAFGTAIGLAGALAVSLVSGLLAYLWSGALRRRAEVRRLASDARALLETMALNEFGVAPEVVSSLPAASLTGSWAEIYSLARAVVKADVGCSGWRVGDLMAWAESLTGEWWDGVLEEAREWTALRHRKAMLQDEIRRLGMNRERLQRLAEESTSLERELALKKARVGDILEACGGVSAARSQYKAYMGACSAVREAEGRLRTLLSSQACDGLEALHERLLMAQNSAIAERERARQLADEYPGLPDPDGALDPVKLADACGALSLRIKSLKDEMEETERRLTDLVRQEAALVEKPHVNVAEAQDKLGQLERQMAAVRSEAEIIGVAYRELVLAKREYQTSHREYLERAITRWFSEITGVAGRAICLDEEFRLFVLDDRGGRRDPSVLSQGAQDQLYIASRLALADMLTDDLILPVIFDDSFVNFDAERTARVRESLTRVATGRQVILLSHEEAYREWGNPVVLRPLHDLEEEGADE